MLKIILGTWGYREASRQGPCFYGIRILMEEDNQVANSRVSYTNQI